MTISYFIAGTDTGVGKTLITSAIVASFAAKKFKSVGMKPVAAGCEVRGEQLISEDVSSLIAASNIDVPLSQLNPYAFEPAIAPHIAAEQAGVTISVDKIVASYLQLKQQADVVIVEGVGGFCVPLNEHESTADLAVKLGLPVIMVVGMRLGCISHALLTAEAITSRGLQLAGWVANQIDPHMAMFGENLIALKQRIKAPCLGVVPWQSDLKFSEVSALLAI